jgi:hypothetical protein
MKRTLFAALLSKARFPCFFYRLNSFKSSYIISCRVYKCWDTTDLHHEAKLVTITNEDESFAFDTEQMSYKGLGKAYFLFVLSSLNELIQKNEAVIVMVARVIDDVLEMM